MKESHRKILSDLVSVDWVWALCRLSLGPWSRIYSRCKHLRDTSQAKANVDQAKIDQIFTNKIVMTGPFQGMQYPGLQSVCSSIYPKLLGSYEHEISPLIEKLCEIPFSSVVDIGCAEGYYAIGMGRRIPGAKVLVFDTDQRALDLCAEMAAMNGVKVEVGGFCSKDTLKTLDLGEQGLVIADCEGYEAELFDEFVAQALSRHHVLVETHDMMRLDATRIVQMAFSSTHSIEEYESVDDFLKAYRYDYPQLEGLNLWEKLDVLAEGRGRAMRWLYMKPLPH